MKNHSIQAFELLTQRKCGRKFSSFEHPPQKKKKKTQLAFVLMHVFVYHFLLVYLCPFRWKILFLNY